MHNIKCLTALLCIGSQDPGPLPHSMLRRCSMDLWARKLQPDFDMHDNTFKVNKLSFIGEKGRNE